MKNLLVAIFIGSILFFATPVFAQTTEPPIPNQPFPGVYILDTLNWLSTSQEDHIISILTALDKEGRAEVYVVTLNDCGADKTSYRKEIFSNWDIGHSDKDGLLILVCWYGGDESRRSVEQQYGGGLGNILSSSVTDQVAKDQFVPKFNEGKPGDGLVAMVEAYDSMIRSGYKPINTDDGEINDIWFGVAVLLMIVVFIYNSIRQKNSGANLDGGFYGRDFGGDGGGGSSNGGGSSTGF